MNLKLNRKILDNKYLIFQKFNKEVGVTNYLTIFVVEDEFSFGVFEKELSIILNDLVDETYELKEFEDYYMVSSDESESYYVISNYDLGVVFC